MKRYSMNILLDRGFEPFVDAIEDPNGSFVKYSDLQSPALGGELEVIYMLRNMALKTPWRDADKAAFDCAAGLVEYERREMVRRAHVAPLLAEIEQLNNERDTGRWGRIAGEALGTLIGVKAERDTLKEHLDWVAKLMVEIKDCDDRGLGLPTSKMDAFILAFGAAGAGTQAAPAAKDDTQ